MQPGREGAKALEALWDSFGANLGAVAEPNWDTFLASLKVAPGLDDISAVDKLEERFKDDVTEEALRRLRAGADLVEKEIARVEAMEQLSLEEHYGPTGELQTAAYQFERAQKAEQGLRAVRVRGDFMGKRPDVTRTRMEWYVEPAHVDPARRPESTTYDDPASDPWKGLPRWEDVKALYDQLAGATLTLADAQPALHVAAGTGNIHDIAVAPEPRYIIEAALDPLRKSQNAIYAANALILMGELTRPRAGRRGVRGVWGHAQLAHRLERALLPLGRQRDHQRARQERDDRPAHRGCGHARAHPARSWLEGPSGLLAVGIGAGISFNQANESWQKAHGLETAEAAKGRIGDDLVQPGVAAATRTQAIVDTVMAFLNLLPAFALAEGAVAEPSPGPPGQAPRPTRRRPRVEAARQRRDRAAGGAAAAPDRPARRRPPDERQPPRGASPCRGNPPAATTGVTMMLEEAGGGQPRGREVR